MIRRIFNYLFRYWSLEKKSLLFIGIALLLSICTSFWFVQKMAEGLVQETTRQIAKDYANMSVAWTHAEKGILDPSLSRNLPPDTYGVMRGLLLTNPNYRSDLLMLESESNHDFLNDAAGPANSDERQVLEHLRDQLRKLQQEESESASEQSDTPTAGNTDSTKAADGLGLYSRNLPDSEKLFVERGPIYTQGGPSSGYYVYYHPVKFSAKCVDCHKTLNASEGEVAEPFRALRVMMPYEYGQLWSARVMAMMIAVAMVTVAVSIFILHFILRNLVILPCVTCAMSLMKSAAVTMTCEPHWKRAMSSVSWLTRSIACCVT